MPFLGLVSFIVICIIVNNLLNNKKQEQKKNAHQSPIVQQERKYLGGYPEQTMRNVSAVPQDILTKAKANVTYKEPEFPLEQVEDEPAGMVHPHDAAHVSKAIEEEDEMILKTIEDLMVKGYDGNLNFERDFVGEAVDMLNSFGLSESTDY